MDRDLLGPAIGARPFVHGVSPRKLRSLRALGTVLGTGLLAVLDALGVQRAADDVVTHTGKVLHTAAADKHDRVFLKVVAFTADVGNDLKAVGRSEEHTSELQSPDHL